MLFESPPLRCFRPRRKGFGSKLIWIYTLFSCAAFCFAAMIAVEAAQQDIPPLLFRVRKRLKLPRGAPSQCDGRNPELCSGE
jgi:hypothetical protein